MIPSPSVLRERRGVEHRINELEPQKPSIGNIDFDLAHALAFRATPEQIANEQSLEHDNGIKRGTPVAGAVNAHNPAADEGEINCRFDVAKEMVPSERALRCSPSKLSFLLF